MSETINSPVHEFGNLPPASGRLWCLADGNPDPSIFPDFVAESFASWQLTRATAWAVVAEPEKKSRTRESRSVARRARATSSSTGLAKSKQEASPSFSSSPVPRRFT